MLRLLSRLVFLLCCVNMSACGSNLWGGFVPRENDSVLLEEARIQMDEENYAAALTTLAKIKSDSNELRLLRSSAQLGAAGLSLWEILLDIIDSDSFDSTEGNGVDNFFDLVSSNLIGEGAVREQRMAALSSSIGDLLTAPDQSVSRPKTLACLLAGMLALPLVNDATAAIVATTNSLSALAATVDVSNPNATCPDSSTLDTNLAAISAAQNSFSLVFAATDDCKLLDISESGNELNAIESQLQKFNTQADQGCSPSPSCGSSQACQALGLSCVYQQLRDSSGVSEAGDAAVSSCELVQNCLTPGSCF